MYSDDLCLLIRVFNWSVWLFIFSLITNNQVRLYVCLFAIDFLYVLCLFYSSVVPLLLCVVLNIYFLVYCFNSFCCFSEEEGFHRPLFHHSRWSYDIFLSSFLSGYLEDYNELLNVKPSNSDEFQKYTKTLFQYSFIPWFIHSLLYKAFTTFL